MKTPNFQISQDFSFGPTIHDQKTLQKYSFVRPIKDCYVPKHVLKGPLGKYYNKETETFCFTSAGIIPIPTKIIREVG